MQTGNSEIAAFKQQQTIQEEAARLGLHGLASGVSRHAFIEARMERAAGHILQLLAEGKQEEAEVLMATQELPHTLAELLPTRAEPEGLVADPGYSPGIARPIRLEGLH